MRSCKSCGCVNDNINRYCRNCGSPMVDEPSARPIGKKYEPEPVMEEAIPPVPMADEVAASPIGNKYEPEPMMEEAIPPVPESAEPEEYEPEPEEYEPTPDEVAPEADFFTIVPSDENALFGDVPPVVDEEKGYIDFDLGTDGEPVAAEPPPLTARERLAGVTRSGVYITFAVTATLGFILGGVRLILALLGEGAGIAEAANEIVDALFILGFERIGAYGVATYAAPASVVAGLCLSVPAVLYLIGIWLHFGGVRGRGTVSLGGLRLVGAGNIVGCILCALALVVTGIAGIAVLATRLYSPAELAPVLDGALVLLGVLALCLTVGIVYHCLALSSVAKLKTVLRGGAADHRMSVFVMMVNLACSIGTASASGFCFGGGDILGGAVYLINTLNFAVLTLLMAKLRVELKEN